MAFKDSEYNHFFDQVYQVVRLIPFGRVSTYGAIAKYLSSARAARMVGWALNCCHSSPDFVPAHRVVNRIGMLTGKHFFGGTLVMQQMLESEGVEVKDDQLVNFSKLFWDPNKEL